ncbi:MAG: nucleotide exchange factor GrpE [Bacteroidaceae bacterium]|nr:nucleotide exchange factor GrpE [Bacteroidaceae bacterium]
MSQDTKEKEEIINEEVVNEEVNNAAPEAAEEAPEAAAAEQTPEEKIAALEAQIEELKKQQLYKVAEFDNYRKRVMAEKADLIKNGGTKIITTLLPVVDDLERAQQNMDKFEDVTAIKEGVNLIIDKMFKLLAQEGLKKMEVVGESFNADLHDAIATVPAASEELKGKVLDCTKAGYTLNDKVIRFAQVVVAQ